MIKHSWFDGDFGDDDGDDEGGDGEGGGAGASSARPPRSSSSSAASAKKRSRPPSVHDLPPPRSGQQVGGVPLRRRRLADDADLWSVRHAPTSAAMLAVHPKKVEEVRSWLSREMSQESSRGGGILLLRGPCGCGKTATISVLTRELGIHVQEWRDSQEVTRFAKRDQQDSDFTSFEDYAPRDDGVPYVSHTKAFRNFMLRANRYKVLNGLGDGAGVGPGGRGKLVLLEELPTFAFRDPGEFHNILAEYQSAGARGYPLVIIISDDSREGRSKNLLSEEAMTRLKVDTVTFNAASSTNLVKTLRSIATVESRSGVRHFNIAEKEEFAALAESSAGDIRGAINSLQFGCLKGGSQNLMNCFESNTKISSTKKLKSSKMLKSQSLEDVPSSLALIGGKDPSLDIFHAIGKVLYCKRQDGCGSELGLTRPRPPLQTCPEELLTKIPMSEDSFSCFLHQSYPDFFTKMDDLAMAADNFSLADGFFNEWLTSSKISLCEYGGLITVRGLCFWNTQVAKNSGMRTFRKPDWYQKIRLVRSRSDILSNAFRIHSLPRVEVSTTYAPMLLKFFPNLLPGGMTEMLSFPGISRCQLAASVPGQVEPLEMETSPGGTEEDFFIEEFD